MWVRRLRVLTFPLAVVAAAALLTAGPPSPAQGAATIVVNTALDEDADNANCSLREAIIAANTNADYHGCTATGAGVNDQITFNTGSGTPTLNISTTPLPPITESVTIDGGAGRVELHGPGGMPVSGAHGLTVSSSGSGSTIRNLVINNFADDGIFIDADDVSVLGCYIGTDATGMTAVPNQGFGVQVFGRKGVHIGGATNGGPCTGDCNLISGATNFKGNVLLDLNAVNAVVHGNFIGTDVTGTAPIVPNDVQGIIDKGKGDTIGGQNGVTLGGSCTGDCNLVSGNNINGGIVINQAATNSVVQGNFVGTDVTGTKAITNGLSEGYSGGIFTYAVGTLIGGTTPEARNVVSGNKGGGIQVDGVSAVVEGNYLGPNSAGTAAIPVSGPGVLVYQADSAMIGGTTAGAANVISGASNNGGDGIEVYLSVNTQIVGNLIGTAPDGVTPLPNQFAGIYFLDQASNNIVGGQAPGAGNVIAFNGGDGVRVDANVPQVRSNTISRNSIYSNGGLGIELVANGNDNLAPPTIEGLDPLHGTACAPCAVEIFSDSDDQGRIFEGSVFTNDGNWTLDQPLTGPNVTATNTDMSNNTSPFSSPVALATASPSPTATIATLTATRTRTRTAASTPTRTAVNTQTATTTATRTATALATATATASRTASGTAVATPTPTSTTVTMTVTPTRSATAASTHTATGSGSQTPAPSATATRTAKPLATATRTVSATAPATATPTPSTPATSSQTATVTVTPPANATATATSAPCTGDCTGTNSVSISDLITGVDIALGNLPVSSCPAFENAEGQVDIAQLIRAVNNALNGCAS
jgi:CSLREA domain-containing protein